MSSSKHCSVAYHEVTKLRVISSSVNFSFPWEYLVKCVKINPWEYLVKWVKINWGDIHVPQVIYNSSKTPNILRFLVILTWRWSKPDHEGASSRMRLLHCISPALTPAISEKVGNVGARLSIEQWRTMINFISEAAMELMMDLFFVNRKQMDFMMMLLCIHW